MKNINKLITVFQMLILSGGTLFSTCSFAQSPLKTTDTTIINKYKLQYQQIELKRGTRTSELEYIFSVPATISAEPKEEFLKIGDKLVLIKEEQQRLREKGYLKIRNYVLFYSKDMLHLYNILPPK
ncbi:MAG: hypothetical protein M0R21_08960 [Lentimicrobiaceae bacterium]|jgi:hypothetical protein|nr:hypothetical protein [Lentimicrobiaceae bacterium]